MLFTGPDLGERFNEFHQSAALAVVEDLKGLIFSIDTNSLLFFSFSFFFFSLLYYSEGLYTLFHSGAISFFIFRFQYERCNFLPTALALVNNVDAKKSITPKCCRFRPGCHVINTTFINVEFHEALIIDLYLLNTSPHLVLLCFAMTDISD